MLAGLGTSALGVLVMLLGVAVVRDYKGLAAWSARSALAWTGATVDEGSTTYHVHYFLNRAGGAVVMIAGLGLVGIGLDSLAGH